MNNNIPGSRTSKIHSRRIDFSLGAGLPELFLMWIAIFASVKKYQDINATLQKII